MNIKIDQTFCSLGTCLPGHRCKAGNELAKIHSGWKGSNPVFSRTCENWLILAFFRFSKQKITNTPNSNLMSGQMNIFIYIYETHQISPMNETIGLSIKPIANLLGGY